MSDEHEIAESLRPNRVLLASDGDRGVRPNKPLPVPQPPPPAGPGSPSRDSARTATAANEEGEVG